MVRYLQRTEHHTVLGRLVRYVSPFQCCLNRHTQAQLLDKPNVPLRWHSYFHRNNTEPLLEGRLQLLVTKDQHLRGPSERFSIVSAPLEPASAFLCIYGCYLVGQDCLSLTLFILHIPECGNVGPKILYNRAMSTLELELFTCSLDLGLSTLLIFIKSLSREWKLCGFAQSHTD